MPVDLEKSVGDHIVDRLDEVLEISDEELMKLKPGPLRVAETPVIAPAPHWERRIKKTVYTLNIDNYEPRIRQLTYPLIKNYAAKIDADFCEITERKFPGWPVVYEKLQIHELGRDNEWSIFVDADTLISPEMFDVTVHLKKDTVCHNGNDKSMVRFRPDPYFLRDGRFFGSCNWFTIASDWCLDLWRPLDDLTPAEAYENIYITIEEHNSGQCKTEHLIDDYALSRNISKFGLKATTVMDICGNLGWRTPDGRGISPFLWHLYTIPIEEKLSRMLKVLSFPKGHLVPNPDDPQAQPLGVGWGLMAPEQAAHFRKEWGVR